MTIINRRQLMKIIMKVLLIVLVIAFAADVRGAEGPKADMKADKTGTNPINFTHDLRAYNEYLFLNTSGDGNQNITTLEFRTPFADGKWQFRARVRGASIEAGYKVIC
jgi:hypothetical protein